MSVISSHRPALADICPTCRDTYQEELEKNKIEEWVIHSGNGEHHPMHKSCLRAWCVHRGQETCPVCVAPLQFQSILTMSEKITRCWNNSKGLISLASIIGASYKALDLIGKGCEVIANKLLEATTPYKEVCVPITEYFVQQGAEVAAHWGDEPFSIVPEKQTIVFFDVDHLLTDQFSSLGRGALLLSGMLCLWMVGEIAIVSIRQRKSIGQFTCNAAASLLGSTVAIGALATSILKFPDCVVEPDGPFGPWLNCP